MKTEINNTHTQKKGVNNGNLISLIQLKIKSLKDEIKAIEYTISIDKITTKTDDCKLSECAYKIQVLNEIIISFGIQK